jgi:deazaflavin-dependent oxidoreductase (nitroreductase family)
MNRRVTNRVLGPLARYLPGFGVVEHRGRRSGRVYRTPVNVFPEPSGRSYAVALTYGSQTDWVRNVLAQGGCTLETRGRRLTLTHPRLVHDDQHRAMPAPVRWVLHRLHVTELLLLDVVPVGTTSETVTPPMATPTNR